MVGINPPSTGSSRDGVREAQRVETCLCGGTHALEDCFALNPRLRPRKWHVRDSVVDKINRELNKDEKLNWFYRVNLPDQRSALLKKVQDLGYEYYERDFTNLWPINRINPDLQSTLVIRPSSPKNPLRLEDLPIEMLTKIVALTYRLTVEEARTLDEDWVRQGRLRVSAKEDPHAYQKKHGPWKYRPGPRGPLFQIMYVSKLFRAIAEPIRYEEVRVDTAFGTSLNYRRYGWRWSNNLNGPIYVEDQHENLDLLCKRLANTTVVQKHTKHIHIRIWYLKLTETITHIVKALENLPKLRHLCLTIKGDEPGGWAGIENIDKDLLLFFNLKIETLSLIWAWGGVGSALIPQKETLDNKAPVASKAEHKMQTFRSRWMENTFYPSSAGEKTLSGQIKVVHDWVANVSAASSEWPTTKVNSKINQWNIDRFIFSTNRTVYPVWWDIWQGYDGHIHPDLMCDWFPETFRRVHDWRRGFHPYTEAELAEFERTEEVATETSS